MFNIHDEGSLPGLADLVTMPPEKSLDDHAVAEYGRALAASDLPIAQTMGVAGDVRGFIERIFFRKLLRELPDETCTFPWFECHVPPGGSTVVSSTMTSAKSASLELKIFGSGLGRGRKTSITVSSTSDPRTRCATYGFDLRVKPRIYDIRGTESVELEVLEILGESIDSHDSCPYCGGTTDDIDRFAFRLDKYLDYRNDRVTKKLGFKVEVKDSLSIDVGMEIPSVPAKLKLGATASSEYSFEIESSFPPGFLYQPYFRSETGPVQTPMWAIEEAA